MRRLLRLWFTFGERVGRREYILSGLGLALLKYAGDALIVWLGAGTVWAPLDYLRSAGTLFTRFASTPHVLPIALAAWALPFVWIGVTMSVRRALDAGWSAWSVLWFFVPGLNYGYMLLMSLLPTSSEPRPSAGKPRPYERRLPGALLAIAAGIGVGLGMLLLSVYALKSYGGSLFLGTPFMIGALTAFVFNRRYPASRRETFEVVVMTIAFLAGAILLFAFEGAVCLLMAAPLAIGLAVMGAMLGRAIALRDVGPVRNAAVALLALPAGAVVDAARDTPPLHALHEVRSAIEIAAPADVVWRSVIAFPPLPAPSELVFRVGIAYPVRAEIEGARVGAVRRCVFSTGAFVEPITRWEPGRRLSFDVTTSPAPMQEWSPYTSVVPPHLDGYFRARRGEFRLVPLAGGRTRLEGSTWYELRIFPEGYWVLFADALVSRIHHRVLSHIQRVAEAR